MESMVLLLDRLLKPVERLSAILAGAFVLVLMVLGCVEVIARSVLNTPIRGGYDLVEQFMVAVATLGIAYCQSQFGNIRMTLVVGRAFGRAQWLLEGLALGIAGFVVAVFVKGSNANLQRAWQLGGDTPDIGIPLWIGIGVVTFALFVLLLRIAIQLLEALRLVAHPKAPSQIFSLRLH